MAASSFEGNFALIPVFENSLRGQVLVFDTPLHAKQFFAEFGKQLGEKEFKKYLNMKPRAVKITKGVLH
jgi:hypothetical protein